jgi:hypothetical protein
MLAGQIPVSRSRPGFGQWIWPVLERPDDSAHICDQSVPLAAVPAAYSPADCQILPQFLGLAFLGRLTLRRPLLSRLKGRVRPACSSSSWSQHVRCGRRALATRLPATRVFGYSRAYGSLSSRHVCQSAANKPYPCAGRLCRCCDRCGPAAWLWVKMWPSAHPFTGL